jgi:hypothetical protein
VRPHLQDPADKARTTREVSGIQRHRRSDCNVDAATKWSRATVDSGRGAPVPSSVRNSSISAMPV